MFHYSALTLKKYNALVNKSRKQTFCFNIKSVVKCNFLCNLLTFCLWIINRHNICYYSPRKYLIYTRNSRINIHLLIYDPPISFSHIIHQNEIRDFFVYVPCWDKYISGWIVCFPLIALFIRWKYICSPWNWTRDIKTI